MRSELFCYWHLLFWSTQPPDRPRTTSRLTLGRKNSAVYFLECASTRSVGFGQISDLRGQVRRASVANSHSHKRAGGSLKLTQGENTPGTNSRWQGHPRPSVFLTLQLRLPSRNPLGRACPGRSQLPTQPEDLGALSALAASPRFGRESPDPREPGRSSLL